MLIAPVPFGHGNLANLELAAEAQTAGKAVVLLGDERFSSRDYAGGQATALLERLQRGGARRYPRLEDWPELIPTNHPDEGPAPVLTRKENPL